MKIIYAPTVFDMIVKARNNAARENKRIEKIILTTGEMEDLRSPGK